MIRRIAAAMLLGGLALAGCAGESAGISQSGNPARNAQAVHAHLFQTIEGRAARVPALARDPWFLAAVNAEKSLNREDFVPHEQRPSAHYSTPLPIGWGQTISDPYIVALMTAAAQVQSGDRVLEVGTGSGYQAAVLARLGARVSTVEIVPQLARRAARVLARLGLGQIATRTGDGFAGWSDHAPFAAILVTAGADAVPQPLLDQLAVGGRLVMPVGSAQVDEALMVITRKADGKFSRCSLGRTSFVELTGSGRRAASPAAQVENGTDFCYGAPVT